VLEDYERKRGWAEAFHEFGKIIERLALDHSGNANYLAALEDVNREMIQKLTEMRPG
jgi:hypothetical protein